MGIYCQHAYAHATKEGAKSLSDSENSAVTLKGCDKAAFSVFRKLNLPITVKSILDPQEVKRDESSEEEESDGSDAEEERALGHVRKTFVKKNLRTDITSDLVDEDDELEHILDDQAECEGDWQNIH